MEIKYKLEIYKDDKLVVTENFESQHQLEGSIVRVHKSYEVLREVMEVTYKLRVEDIDEQSQEDWTTAKFYSEPYPVAEEVLEEPHEVEKEPEIIPEDNKQEETARIYTEDVEVPTNKEDIEEYLDERDSRNFDY